MPGPSRAAHRAGRLPDDDFGLDLDLLRAGSAADPVNEEIGDACPDLISRDALIKILAGLEPGFTELGTHPGMGDDLDTMYCSERAEELKVLCDPQVRAAIDDLNIRLCSFGSLCDIKRAATPVLGARAQWRVCSTPQQNE